MADTAFGERGIEVGEGSNGEGGSGAIPWASKAGHVETVFTCEHRPGDADTLATGSYGASVKVWHVPTMDLKVSGQMGRCQQHIEFWRSYGGAVLMSKILLCWPNGENRRAVGCTGRT